MQSCADMFADALVRVDDDGVDDVEQDEPGYDVDKPVAYHPRLAHVYFMFFSFRHVLQVS